VVKDSNKPVPSKGFQVSRLFGLATVVRR